MKEHIICHNEQPLLGTSKKIRKYKERAKRVEDSINEILKIAAEKGLSYGQAVAEFEKLKEKNHETLA